MGFAGLAANSSFDEEEGTAMETTGAARINGMVMRWAEGIELPNVAEGGDDTDRVSFIVGVETWVGKHYSVASNQWQNCIVTPWDVEQYRAYLAGKEEERAALSGAGFTVEDIAAIISECPSTAAYYRIDKYVLRFAEKCFGSALKRATMTHDGKNTPYSAKYHVAVEGGCVFTFSYIRTEEGSGWRTVMRDAASGEIIEIADRHAGDWEDAMIYAKLYLIGEVEGAALTGYELSILLAHDSEWKVVDEGGLETVLECRACSGRERFQSAGDAWEFVNTERSEEHLHVANGVSGTAGDVADNGAVVAVHAGSQGGAQAGAAQERYTVKASGQAGAYAIDGGPFESFAALVELARCVSRAEGSFVYIRDNARQAAAIAFDKGTQVTPVLV